MAIYIKVELCDVVRTPVGGAAYYEPTDEGRLEFIPFLDEIKEHMRSDQEIQLTAVEMSEAEYHALGTSPDWYKIWEMAGPDD